MNSITALQWVTFGGFIVLAFIGAWATRYPTVRPWALAALTWAINNIGFYAAYLIIGDGTLTPFLIGWSAVTRLHGQILAAGALLVAVLARRGVGHD